MARALLHTLAGLYDSRGEYLNGGLSRELAERLLESDPSVRKRRMGKLWVLSVDPNLYREVARRWILDEPRIELRLETRVVATQAVGTRLTHVHLEGAGESSSMAVNSLVDATGSAAAISVMDEALRESGSSVAAAGWIFRIRGVANGAFVFPRNVAVVRALREGAQAGQLPPECGHAWIDSGLHADEVFVKLFVPLGPGWEQLEVSGAISRATRQTQERVLEFLRTLQGFEEARVTETGRLGIRDGGRARGEYTLSKSDVLGSARFPDAACRCAWPIEYWDSSQGVALEYLPDGDYYEIPLRALKVRGVQNVWAAGKCLSADVYAQASARCVGTCWAMGEAAGAAAARFESREHTTRVGEDQ